jgi:putative GTP pyrophosphokinase
MRSSEDEKMPKTDVETVLDEFEAKKGMFGEFCNRTKSLIEAGLQDADIQYESVQFRVKSSKKLRKKYLDPAKDYRRLYDITDLAGLRVVTYYEDDVDRVAEVIKKEFLLDLENSVDKRVIEPDRFGYHALNLVCWHLEKRTSDVEYKKFKDVRCEIQITSILRHGWSEMEHEWYDLQGAYPHEIKRRFSRIMALLEIAESEFRDIRKRRTEYERSVDVRIGANDLDVPIDAVSLRSFIAQEPLVSEIDKSIASALSVTYIEELSDASVERRSMAAKLAGMTKLQNVRDHLKKYRHAVPEYAGRCKREVWADSPSGNAVTKGVSIYHLSQFLVNLQGTEATDKFLKAHGFVRLWDTSRQVAIAREIAEKYSN